MSKTRIVNPYTYTWGIWGEKLDTAFLITTLKIETESDFINEYNVVVEGKCGDSEFCQEYRPFCAHCRIGFPVANPKLWWPKNYGEQNLYDVTVTLYHQGIVCDQVSYKLGIRR